MTRFIMAMFFLLTTQLHLQACDACGSSIMGQQPGLLSAYRKSFVSMGWSQSLYHSVQGAGEGSTDLFNTMDFTFQHFLTNRWSVGLYQPYRINTRTTGATQTAVSGLADTRLNVNYTFYEQNDTFKPIEAYLGIGAWLILPTGVYDPDIHNQNLPENFNPGNGSLGMQLQQTCSFSYRSLGMLLKNNWTYFSETKTDYRYGRQWAGSLLLFWDYPVDSILSIVPMAGIQMEVIGSDQYANGVDVHGTGGNGIYLPVGGQVKLKNWLCTFQYTLPLQNTYGSGEVDAGHRFNIQLTHLFNSKK